MSWIVLSLSAYFLLAIVAIIDKFLLTEQKIKSKIYAFYVGLLGLSALILMPFGFSLPNWLDLGIAFVSGIIWICALLVLYESLHRFEVSRIVPAVGGLLPIFSLGFTYLFSWVGQSVLGGLSFLKIISLLLLIIGSVLITFERKDTTSKKSFIFSGLAALLFGLSFSTAKILYMDTNFISAFVLMRLAGFIAVLFLLFTKEVREELFKKKKQPNKKSLFRRPKTALLFLVDQTMGAGAIILQNVAIYIAPAIYLAFINALDGTRYVFIFIIAIVISRKFPKILSEKITKTILVQKTLAIILIISGLIILSFN